MLLSNLMDAKIKTLQTDVLKKKIINENFGKKITIRCKNILRNFNSKGIIANSSQLMVFIY